MRILVLTERADQIPAEVAADLMAATDAWIDTNAANIESTWGNAGRPGGGGILNVDSLEQLEKIMLGFPLGRYSKITITPVIDLKTSLGMIQEMMST